MTKSLSMLDDSRVLLRPIADHDAEFLMQLNNDLEIAKFVVGTPKQVTLQEQMQWMEKTKNETKTSRFIVEAEGAPMGTVILSDIDMKNLIANINIKLQGSARGKGIGKCAVKQALAYCFNNLELCCVTAHVLSFNVASLALFDRCGFAREGILRSRVIKDGKRCDLVSYSMTRKEYIARLPE